MILDEVPFCYKEYPPVPQMQCEGHKKPVRLALLIPGIIVGILIIGIILGGVL